MMDEIKPGDVFEIRVEVKDARDGNAKVTVTAATVTSDFSFILLKSVLRAGHRVARPLTIGDRVTIKGTHAPSCDLVAIHDTWAMLTRSGSVPFICALSDLERAPAPDTKEGT